MHAQAFIEHFHGHSMFPLQAVITRDSSDRDCIVDGAACVPVDLCALRERLDVPPSVVFFNSGRWIEDLSALRRAFPKALFVYRTGGNEILKAPLERIRLAEHTARQAFWVQTLNGTIDLLITNSGFTERRLAALGILEEKLARVVGGVRSAGSVGRRPPGKASGTAPRFFCAARFVPYKNHVALIDIFRIIASKGESFSLRLAGDGPLLPAAQEQIARYGLDDQCKLLGPLSNEDVGRELAEADYYIQLSSERPTEVPGGSYIHAEGMGRSILEAISYGTYVIATRTGALPEIVTPGRGTLVSFGSPEEIAAHVLALLSAPPPKPPPTDEYAWERCFKLYELLWRDTRAPAPRH